MGYVIQKWVCRVSEGRWVYLRGETIIKVIIMMGIRAAEISSVSLFIIAIPSYILILNVKANRLPHLPFAHRSRLLPHLLRLRFKWNCIWYCDPRSTSIISRSTLILNVPLIIQFGTICLGIPCIRNCRFPRCFQPTVLQLGC